MKLTDFNRHILKKIFYNLDFEDFCSSFFVCKKFCKLKFAGLQAAKIIFDSNFQFDYEAVEEYSDDIGVANFEEEIAHGTFKFPEEVKKVPAEALISFLKCGIDPIVADAKDDCVEYPEVCCKPLNDACKFDNFPLAMAIFENLNYDVKYLEGALIRSARAGSIKIFKYLISLDFFDSTTKRAYHALKGATISGRYEIIKILLDLGVNPAFDSPSILLCDTLNRGIETQGPREDRAKIFKLLLQDSRVDALDHDNGYYVMERATFAEDINYEIVKMLCDRYKNIDCVGMHKQPFLHPYEVLTSFKLRPDGKNAYLLEECKQIVDLLLKNRNVNPLHLTANALFEWHCRNDSGFWSTPRRY